MAKGYGLAEFRQFREYGGILLPRQYCELEKNVYKVEWPVQPNKNFHDYAEMRLLFRQPVKRIEVMHLTLVLRGDHIMRLDINHSHRENGVTRKGHHIHWKEDSDRNQKTSFDLDPPLIFPESIQTGHKAEYWKAIEWFCRFSKLNTSRVDLSDFEAVKE